MKVNVSMKKPRPCEGVDVSISPVESKHRFTKLDLLIYALQDEIQNQHKSRSRSREGINDILPEEIMFYHIFVRLSTKTLICCRSVCKAWNRVIRDPKFVNHHLNQQHNNHKFLFRANNTRYYCVDYGEEVGNWFTFQAPSYCRQAEILDSCNGLVSMIVNHGIYPFAGYKLHLWNPITSESRIIPDPDPYIGRGELLGYGYDSSIDDYKVLRVIKTDRMDVYSLRNNSWKMLEFGYSELQRFTKLGFGRVGVGVNGYVYWVVKKPDSESIYDASVVGLCLRDYQMTEIRMPYDYELGDRNGVSVTALKMGTQAMGSCLGLYNYEKPLNFVLWTLKETEERKWEKIITLSLSSVETIWYELFRPLLVTEEGKVVIFAGGSMSMTRFYKLGL